MGNSVENLNLPVDRLPVRDRSCKPDQGCFVFRHPSHLALSPPGYPPLHHVNTRGPPIRTLGSRFDQRMRIMWSMARAGPCFISTKKMPEAPG